MQKANGPYSIIFKPALKSGGNHIHCYFPIGLNIIFFHGAVLCSLLMVIYKVITFFIMSLQEYILKGVVNAALGQEQGSVSVLPMFVLCGLFHKLIIMTMIVIIINTAQC